MTQPNEDPYDCSFKFREDGDKYQYLVIEIPQHQGDKPILIKDIKSLKAFLEEQATYVTNPDIDIPKNFIVFKIKKVRFEVERVDKVIFKP